MKNTLFYLGFLFLMTFCNNSKHISYGDQSNNFEILYLSEYGGSGEDETFVYRESSEFEEMWNETINSMSGLTDIPAVDFSKKMVVAKHFKSQNSGGNEFGIDSVVQSEAGTTVYYTVIPPAKFATMAITTPLMIVVTDKTDNGEVKFEIKRQ